MTATQTIEITRNGRVVGHAHLTPLHTTFDEHARYGVTLDAQAADYCGVPAGETLGWLTRKGGRWHPQGCYDIAASFSTGPSAAVEYATYLPTAANRSEAVHSLALLRWAVRHPDALILTADGELASTNSQQLEASEDNDGDETLLADGSHVLLTLANLYDQTDADDVETDEDGVILRVTRECAQSVAEGLNEAYRMLLAEADVKLATAEAETAALRRAQAVARLVEACDGNQSEAARRLGLHQTTVNKLVLRARRAAEG